MDALARAYGLCDFCKALLGARLARVHHQFVQERIVYKKPADPAALKQLGKIKTAVAYLANLDHRSRSYIAAMAAMNEAQEKHGRFEFHTAIYGSVHGPKKSVLDWLHQSRRILETIKEAEALLAGPNPDPGQNAIKVGRETMFYGYRLPRLYELTTGQPFGISRSRNKVVANPSVRFVLFAAAVIFVRPCTPANVERHFTKAKRAGLWKHATRPAKKKSPVARDTT